jgi:spermidine synthase
MKPIVQLAEATTPDGSHLALCEHDGEYFLKADGARLMTSFAHASEEHLARLACALFRPAAQPRILIGGLGLGYTIAEARLALPQSRAHFTVAELVPEVLQWNRQLLAHLHPGLWEDARVTVKIQDVTDLMAAAPEAYHAILLDADNGPEAFTGFHNKGFDTLASLHLAHEALKEGGLLAVWSATPDPVLEKRLRNTGFDVSTEMVPAAHKGKRKRRHTIWLARKGAYQSQHHQRRR